MSTWTARRWLVALAAAATSVVVVAVPTDLIDTPWFGRDVPPTWWSWPALLISSVLFGMLAATYVRESPRPEPAGDEEPMVRGGWLGGLLTFFAVGCPVCNKVVLLALGYSGALTWFQPVQPLLAVAALGLLAWALRRRLRYDQTCPLPTRVASDV
ncbi:hypothetical protein [Nocardioides acrostichi]|uniref:Integral membrane protein n=1 Tax=Nocardioides acrostichi TaxID=2784339 RepID=A0A930YBY2_9ACTN|nr:hypothetical protein [Nocardioides acrostichi]MBF4160929.1 hypothetical protein [Nocardioides acrostichi]